MANFRIKVDRNCTRPEVIGEQLVFPFSLAPSGQLRKGLLEPVRGSRDLKLSPETLDVLDIATAVVYADRYCPRGVREHWVRNIEIEIELRNFARFAEISEELEYCLSLLGGDNIKFIGKQITSEIRYPRYKRINAMPVFTDVALLSGGQDSMVGAAQLLQNKRNPLFVRIDTHDKANVRDIQRALRRRFQVPVTTFIQPQPALRLSGSKKLLKEPSQRLRSFYFLSVASAYANSYGVSNVYINENAIMAIHLPLDPSRSSTFSTKTAHPTYLQALQGVLRRWMGGDDLSIKNLHIDLTKGEVIKCAEELALHGISEDTISCAHAATVQQTVKITNRPDLMRKSAQDLHCGYCFPCILRRISMTSAGILKDVNYAVNPFEVLVNGEPDENDFVREASSAILSLIRFSRPFLYKSDEELLAEFPQIFEAAAALDFEEKTIIDVHRRFASEVFAYVTNYAPFLRFLFDRESSADFIEVIDPNFITEIMAKENVVDLTEAAEKSLRNISVAFRWKIEIALTSKVLNKDSAERFLRDRVREVIGSDPNVEKRVTKTDVKEISSRAKNYCNCPPFSGRRNA